MYLALLFYALPLCAWSQADPGSAGMLYYRQHRQKFIDAGNGAPESLKTQICGGGDANIETYDAAIRDGVVMIGNLQSGELLYSHNGIQELTKDTKMPIASGSKWLTAVCVLRALEKNNYNMNTSLNEIFSWWTAPIGDNRSGVSIKHILSLTSGISTVQEDGYSHGASGYAWLRNCGATMVECAEHAYNNFWTYAPGSYFHYGGNSFQIAAAAVEAVTGQNWSAAWEDMLSAAGLSSSEVDTEATDPPFPNLDGGNHISPANFFKFMKAFTGGQLLNQANYYDLLYYATGNPPCLNSPFCPQELEMTYGLCHWTAQWPEVDGLIAHSVGLLGFFPVVDTAANMFMVIAPPFNPYNWAGLDRPVPLNGTDAMGCLSTAAPTPSDDTADGAIRTTGVPIRLGLFGVWALLALTWTKL